MGTVPMNPHIAQPPTMLIMLPTHSQTHLGPHLQLHTLPTIHYPPLPAHLPPSAGLATNQSLPIQ